MYRAAFFSFTNIRLQFVAENTLSTKLIKKKCNIAEMWSRVERCSGVYAISYEFTLCCMRCCCAALCCVAWCGLCECGLRKRTKERSEERYCSAPKGETNLSSSMIESWQIYFLSFTLFTLEQCSCIHQGFKMFWEVQYRICYIVIRSLVIHTKKSTPNSGWIDQNMRVFTLFPLAWNKRNSVKRGASHKPPSGRRVE